MDSCPSITHNSGLEQNSHPRKETDPGKKSEWGKGAKCIMSVESLLSRERKRKVGNICPFSFSKIINPVNFSSSLEKRVKRWREESVLHYRYYLPMEDNLSNEEVSSALPPTYHLLHPFSFLKLGLNLWPARAVGRSAVHQDKSILTFLKEPITYLRVSCRNCP